jgi:hypothetical protein
MFTSTNAKAGSNFLLLPKQISNDRRPRIVLAISMTEGLVLQSGHIVHPALVLQNKADAAQMQVRFVATVIPPYQQHH